MTAQKLIEVLQKANPNEVVFMSSDSEGNSFAPVQRVDEDGGIVLFPSHEIITD